MNQALFASFGAKLLLRCDVLRRATLSAKLPIYEDIKAAQREEHR